MSETKTLPIEIPKKKIEQFRDRVIAEAAVEYDSN